MAKTKQKTQVKEQKQETKANNVCTDEKCPFHGTLSVRGRVFRGVVIKKFSTRVVIELERTIYIHKYERYAKSKTKLHAKLPNCLANEINIGDYIEIRECRKLSKIISFVVMKKIRSGSETENKGIQNESKEENMEEIK